jgi:hypothetical protein
MSTRSVFIGIVTLLRLMSSNRVRTEFGRATSELESANNEVRARLARMRREADGKQFSLEVVSTTSSGSTSERGSVAANKPPVHTH